MRAADALFALGRVEDALAALEAGAARWPPFAGERDYSAIRAALVKALGKGGRVAVGR